MEDVAEDVEDCTGALCCPSQDVQIQNVARFIKRCHDTGIPVTLILGATNFEWERLNGPGYIFFDRAEHDPAGRPYIKGSFNKLNLLSKMVKGLGPTIDQITIDRSTSHTVKWTKDRIKLYAAMTTSEGGFVYNPYFGSFSIPLIRYTGGTTEDDLRTWIRANNSFSEDVIPLGGSLPLIRSEEVRTRAADLMREEMWKPHLITFFKTIFSEVSLKDGVDYPIQTEEDHVRRILRAKFPIREDGSNLF